jgi:protein gp37
MTWTPLHKDHVLERWLHLVSRTPCLQWLVLTKYPEYIIPTLSRVARLGHSDDTMKGSVVAARWLQGYFPRNVWLGVSVEDQERLSQRVFYLRNVEARVKFLVAEPMLTAMTIRHWFDRARFESDPFNWLVIGGEAGMGSRKFDTEWAVNLVDEARAYGIPVWVNGVGSNVVTATGATGRIRLETSDEAGSVPADWPEALRIRELPELEGS